MDYIKEILVWLWGSRYRLHAVTLLICSGIVFFRWSLGHRDLEQFAADPVLSWVALVGSMLGLLYAVLWRRKVAGYRSARKFIETLPALLLGTLLVLICIGLRFYSYQYGVWDSFKEGEIGILVGAIPGDQDRKQQNSYINAIRSLVVEDATLRGVVKVWPLYREFPSNPDVQQEEALRLAGRLRASFVIRPVAEAGGSWPWLTIASQSGFPRAEVALGKVTNLAELDSMALTRDVALLARCAAALSFYRRGQYPQAVEQFTQILHVATLPDAAPARPYLSFLLGHSHLYERASDPASILPKAIAAYDQALNGFSRERYPTEWAATMNNRGAAYRELPGPDRAANLKKAIDDFDQALEVRTRDRYPTDWAMTMNNRGEAYRNLPGPDREANLKKAIDDFDLAREVYTRERYPTEWATTMNNRGATYGELPGPDRAANLKKAIDDFDLAREVYTRERYPTEWAMTMNNRGNAYRELQGPDREANLKEAIRSFDSALAVYTRERYPTDWATTMNNRGTAYGDLPGPDREANLQEAIRCYEEALATWEEQGMTHYAEMALRNLTRARSALAELTGMQ